MGLRLRYRLGTARLHVVTRTRFALGRMRTRPTTAAAVPRPPRPANGRTLRLTHALVASDLNPRYLDFWPLVRRAWRDIVGVEPILVLVADEAPEPLARDPSVRVFTPLPGIHTAFQAQCIRLLYPALLEADGGVIVSDADMVPMNARYFHRPAGRIAADHFVAYRDVYLSSGEIPMCYNAALPGTWGTVFGITSHDAIRARLAEWAESVDYAGVHGGAGWLTDQQILYRTLLDRGARAADVWILDDHYTGYRRLERAELLTRGRLDARDRRLIRRGAYSDFHCVHPYAQFKELNDLAVDLAVESIRRGRGPRRARPATRARLGVDG